MNPNPRRPRPGVILSVLTVAGGAYALLQSLVVPALPFFQGRRK